MSGLGSLKTDSMGWTPFEGILLHFGHDERDTVNIRFSGKNYIYEISKRAFDAICTLPPRDHRQGLRFMAAMSYGRRYLGPAATEVQRGISELFTAWIVAAHPSLETMMVVPKALKTKDSLLRSVSHNKIEKSLEALISPDNIQEPVLCNIPLDVPERVLAGWFIVNERWPNSKDAEEMRARGRFTIDPQAR